MALLQKLLSDRSEVMLLYQNLIICSCGDLFNDFSDAENHLVKHPKTKSCETKQDHATNIRETLKNLLNNLMVVENYERQTKSSQKYPKTITLPDKVVAVTLEEDTLKAGLLRSAVCSECAEQLDNFDALKGHYQAMHNYAWEPICPLGSRSILRELPSKKDFLTGWTFRFHCPIPGCKYHLLTDSAKYFGKREQLKQHYSKIHAHRMITCNSCGEGFATEIYLKRHQTSACGKSFKCLDCNKRYTSIEILKTHCRRKHHSVPPHLIKRLQKSAQPVLAKSLPVFNIVGNLITTVPTIQIQSQPQVTNTKRKTDKGLVRIEPKPSPMHLTAAIALSELAGETAYDKAIVVSAPSTISISQQPTSKICNSAEVQTYLSSSFTTVSEQETQTTKLGARFVNFEPCYSASSLLTSDKLNGCSSTQTSPRVTAGLFNPGELTISTSHLPSKISTRDIGQHIDPDDLLLLTSSHEGGSYGDHQLSSRRRPPKLCEIEQFSTETQTDADFELLRLRLLKQPNSPESEVEDDPMFGSISRNQMEAETQFDLDDILCSNYTQTTGDDDDMMPSLLQRMEDEECCPCPVTFNSSKTQTVCTGFNSATLDAFSQPCQTNQQGESQCELIHMETQTAVEDLFLD